MTSPGEKPPPPGNPFWPTWLRDLHLYCGLFISPFIILFALSVVFLVHPRLSRSASHPAIERSVQNLSLPANLDQLSGRERIEALKPVLRQARVPGEVGWIQHQVQENRLIIPVTVPGHLATVTLDLAQREARIREENSGLASALVLLHKSPGPHLVGLRMNWFPMRVWFWLADATVYLVLFLTLSGVYLWALLRSERRIGILLLAAGAITFCSLIYELVY